ncbi:MAG: HD-GYP domain-containing protein [Solirubrobacterales bacterium]
MQKISIGNLKSGTSLGRDIYSSTGQLLLRKGSMLDENVLSAFKRQGIEHVFVLDIPQRRTHVQVPFNQGYTDSVDQMKNFLLEAQIGQPLEQPEVDQTVSRLLNLVYDEVDIFQRIRQMKNTDEYLYTHSLNVSLLCVMIARWLKCPPKMIKDMGLAGLLHDIGKANVPTGILTKPEPLTEEELHEVQSHAVKGFEIAQKIPWISKDILDAVRLHHERLDGSGYPEGLEGDAIPLIARVVAVADVYDAITSERVYAGKMSPYQAAEVLWDESFGRLDPRIAKVFYDRASNFYIGNTVILSNGMIGKVVYINPTMPTRPVVESNGEYHDLSRNRTVTITEVVD